MFTDNITIATLLIISASCQILGTIAVSINYYRTGIIAKIIDDTSNSQLLIPFKERAKVAALAKELKRSWWLTLGLFSYVFAAISGLVASLIWLFR